MKHTTDQTTKIILGNNRRYTAGVVFNFLSCKTPESISLHCPNAQRGSVPEHIVYPYLSHITNRLFTQQPIFSRVFPNPENYHKTGNLVQVKKRAFSHIGYIGKKADPTGTVYDTITQYIPNTNIKSITIRTNQDRIIRSATLIIKNMQGKIIAQKDIKNNTQSEIIVSAPCENARSMELTITHHTPSKRIWLISFYAGFEFAVSESDIVSIKHSLRKTENKEGSIGRLYIATLNLVLSNISRIYDDENEDSPIAGYFNSNAVLSCAIYLQNESQSIFEKNFGTFFVSDIQNDHSKATVTIKAQDYIAIKKNTKLFLGIKEKTSAHACFAAIAQSLNLSANKIESILKTKELNRLPLNGTVSKLLNDLCVATNTYCSIDETGSALIATPVKARHGQVRYPLRYLATTEYAGGQIPSTKSKSPNVVNLEYSLAEYENEYQAGRRESILYTQIPKRAIPHQYTQALFGEYPVGMGQTPSLTKTYDIPKNFVTVELSDPFIPKSLEWEITTNYQTKKITVKVWNFSNRNEGEQLTIALMIMQKPHRTLLKKQDIVIPKKPLNYTALANDPTLDEHISSNVIERNKKNKPFQTLVTTDTMAEIHAIEIANIYKQNFFEFTHEKTPQGYLIHCWNYTEAEQTLTVKLYGLRLKPATEKKVITHRNEADIQVNGEIEKTITLTIVGSEKQALETLKDATYYYSHYINEGSVKPWADPRLELYDLIAFRSVRGYGYTQGIIDEIESTYKGYLEQNIKLKLTKKHTRDARISCGYISCDRPIISRTNPNYA